MFHDKIANSQPICTNKTLQEVMLNNLVITVQNFGN